MAESSLTAVQIQDPVVAGEQNIVHPLVLVTEDHEELRNFICSTFSSNYRVISASNGKEGWVLAQSELPDVIMSDAMMAEGDGIEFCRKIKLTPGTSHIAFYYAYGEVISGKHNRWSCEQGRRLY